jgi:hypothetical protein
LVPRCEARIFQLARPTTPHGVELAAIKALYERVQKEEALIEGLERENQELRLRTLPPNPKATAPRR